MNLNDLMLFIHTADSGSLTRAAVQLDMTTAAASAALKRLEKQLNVQLFIRTTRRIRITSEGERFLVYCRKAISSIEEGKASIHALEGKVAGELRISIPSDLGRNLLLGWLDEIMQQHPQLSINLLLGDAIVDFYNSRVDLAIRYGTLEDSNMIAFRLASVNRILCASPDYVDRYGQPSTPEQLPDHNCLLFQLNNKTFDYWQLESSIHPNKEDIRIRVASNRTANDGDVVHRWALEGKGIALKSLIDIKQDINQGKLIRVLPEFQSPSTDLNLLCPTRKQVTPAALMLRDILRQKLTQHLEL